MNKSAEEQAEEIYGKRTESEVAEGWNHIINLENSAFVRGHQSRDEEVKKLVGVLEEYMVPGCFLSNGEYEAWYTKAKEALKPYQK